MAVFPDRIVLKNSTDTDQDVRAAIGTGGSNAIVPGEIVVRADSNFASLYTLDSAGNVVEIVSGGSVGVAGVTELNYYDGYVNNFRLSNLADVDADGDAKWSNVTTLIPGVSTSTDVADGVTYGSVSSNSITNVLNAAVDPSGGPYLATSFKLTAGYFSANGTVAAFGFGTGTWTIEGWYKFSTLATKQVLMSNQVSNATNPYLNIFIESGQLKFQYTLDGVATTAVTAFAPALDVWYHISFSRFANGAIQAYWAKQDGTGGSSWQVKGSGSGNFDGNSNLLTIGAIDNAGVMESASTFNVADFRITKGDYRYSSFPHYPPTAAMPNNGQVQANDDVIVWNSTAGAWQAQSLDLGQLGNVDLSIAPAAGDSLTWNGTSWVAGAGGGGAEWIDQLKDVNTGVFGTVDLLFSFDGLNGDTTTTDAANGVVPESFGTNCQISSEQSKFGGTSLKTVSDGIVLSHADSLAYCDFADKDFTIEAWVYPTASASNWLIAWSNTTISVGGNLQVGLDVISKTLTVATRFTDNTSETLISTASADTILNTWTHVAVSRKAGKFYGFINGKLLLSDADNASKALAPMSAYAWLAWKIGPQSSGYLDDYRQVSGAALYTEEFTPPTAALTTGPQNGQALVWNSTSKQWVPGTVSGGGGGALGDLTDVTLTGVATGNYLKYDGAEWVNTGVVAGDIAMDGGDFDTGLTDDTTTIFDQFPISIDAHSDVDTSTTPPTSGQALVWNGVDNWVPGNVATGNVALNDLTDVTITAAATGEVLRYNGSAWVDAQLAYSDLSGTPSLATVATSGAYADLSGTPSLATVATSGAYADLTGTPSLATVATSGAYADLSGTPSLATVATSGSYNDLADKPTIPASIDDLSDVDTTTAAPTVDQVLVWDGTNWVPGNQTGGGGGAGGAVQTAFVTEAQTASGGAATFTGVGKSGQLVQITSSLDAWIVLYPTAAARTADAGRGFGADPAPGSGVLAEFYITAGSTVLATPGTTYFNNDTTKANAIYAAVRDQAGASVNSEVTLECYAADGTIGYRTTLTATTSSLADDTAGDLTFTETGKSGRFISIATDRAAWVTLYTSTAARTADSSRPITTDPSPGSGVLAEVLTAGAETIKLTPAIGYFNDETVLASELYAKVVNKSGATSTVQVDLTVVPAEA